MDLNDRIALVSGGASGIGRATALQLAALGARVAIVDLDAEGGKESAQAVLAAGGRATFVAADVGTSAGAAAAVEGCSAALGGLDVLVSNAGINPRGTVLDTEDEKLDRILDVNLKATFYLCRYAVPIMRARGGGSIVTVSSINGLVAWENEAAYDASKGGVVMLTRALAVDHARDNIRVNCVCPGIIQTPMLQRTASTKDDPEQFLKDAAAMQPLRRLGRPEDVARVIAFLAGDWAGYVTGAVLPVDGGYTAV